MFGFFYAFMSIVYANTLESGDKKIFFFKGLRLLSCQETEPFL